MSEEEAEKEASAAPEIAAELEVEGGEAPAVPAPDGAQESAVAGEYLPLSESPAPENSNLPSALESDLPPASEIIPQETEPPEKVVPEPPPSSTKEEPVRGDAPTASSSPQTAHSPTPRHSAREHMQKVVGERLQARLTQILTLVAQRNVVSNNDVQVLLAVSDATATRYLSRLVKTGLLRRSGEGTGTRYELAIGSNSAV